jgi:hypothetical protein
MAEHKAAYCLNPAIGRESAGPGRVKATTELIPPTSKQGLVLIASTFSNFHKALCLIAGKTDHSLFLPYASHLPSEPATVDVA